MQRQLILFALGALSACQTAVGSTAPDRDSGPADGGDADSDSDTGSGTDTGSETDTGSDTPSDTDTGPDPCVDVIPAPIVDWGFDACDDGWTFGGTNQSWECGRPTSGPENDRDIGGNLVATNVGGDYHNEESSFAVSPEVDTSGSTCVRLRFWHWYEFETVGGATRDGGLVEASTDGVTWTIVTPMDGYDGRIDAGPSDRYPDGEDGFTNAGAIQEWQEEIFDVSSFASPTLQVRLYFGSDVAGVAPGWYVDDVVIEAG